MLNKITVVLLVLLLAATGGLGYYGYTMNQQIISLNSALLAQQQQQTAAVNALEAQISALNAATTTRLDQLSGEIKQTADELSSLQSQVTSTGGRIDALQGSLADTTAEVQDLAGRLDNFAGLSASVINASQIYERASEATVSISNGLQILGSGFLYDDAGHVATAYHVIENRARTYVIFPDGTVSTVVETAGSVESDVAILTIIDKPTLAPPPLGNSSQVHAGDPVAAIGSPFGVPGTLTSGIISQTDRFTQITAGATTRWVANLLQFDAAANFGNSGGPLFNTAGEVIGLVNARVNPDEGDGIYYAVSINKVKKVADALITTGSFDYPWLGVNVSDLTPNIVQERALDSIYGALVQSVSPGGSASTAGIAANDIIVGIDGYIIRSVSDLTSYLGENKNVGDEAVLVILRGNDRREITATIFARPAP
ncbi:MAG: trypsin-like peptidase domain-containing protein [Chloroflexota bacterium]